MPPESFERKEKVDIPLNTEEQLVNLDKSVNSDLDTLLQKKNIVEVMDVLGIPSSYKDRYALIHKLFDNGVILFDGSLNQYSDETDFDTNGTNFDTKKYKYIGNTAQNEKFKSQIIKNRHLFVNGKLPKENINQWDSGNNKKTVKITAVEKTNLNGMNLAQVLEKLGVGSDYNSRYRLSQQLAKNGVPIFTGKLNPYVDEKLDNQTGYIGNKKQNLKLKRNLVENAHLFGNGVLTDENAKKWNVVE